MEDCVTSLIIGDPHFKSGCPEVYEYIDRITEIAKKYSPTFIVILGDVLDKHGVVEVEPHKAVERLLENLSNISPTYVLMGNHDLINSSQYLTNNHIYGPFKKWPSLFIVDKPMYVEYFIGNESKNFVFAPYVPPGKFQMALDTLLVEGYDWNFADCIFAHQEFRGCKLAGGMISVKGDEWSEDFPLVVSGHMHEPHNIGENIMYPGNTIQHSYKDRSDKKVWIVKFFDDVREIKKVKIGLKQKIQLNYSVNDIKKDTAKILKKAEESTIHLIVKGESGELKNFRKSELYKTFNNKKITVIFDELIKPVSQPHNNQNIELPSYEHILRTIIQRKNKSTIEEFDRIFQSTINKK